MLNKYSRYLMPLGILLIIATCLIVMAADPTLPIGNLSPIAAHTFIGNSTGATAQPIAVKPDLGNDVTGTCAVANCPDKSTLLMGWCQGTIGAGSIVTYGLQPGSTAVSNCSTIGVVELPMPITCTAQKLYATAGLGGLAAGSGTMTVYKNTAATTLTCAMGSGVGATSCNDTTHTVSFTAGDTWSLRVTSGVINDTNTNFRGVFQCL